MTKRFLSFCGVIIFSTLSVLAQDTNQDKAATNRYLELLRRPTFITLRLRMPANDEEKLYYEKAPIAFEVFMTQNSFESLTVWHEAHQHYQYRPELTRNGEVVPYTKEAQEGAKIADTQPFSGSSKPQVMKPGQEYTIAPIQLDHWYHPLDPARYRLIVRKRFTWDGDWAESNALLFDVLARKAPNAIPDDVFVRLTVDGSQPQSDEKVYRLTADAVVHIWIVNNSNEPVRCNVADTYYSDRLQLFRDGKSIPYSKETADLIRAKDENPYHVGTVSESFYDPNTTVFTAGVRLNSWFGPLAPGKYRLTNRHRFEINGPWTDESAPLVFEIPPK